MYKSGLLFRLLQKEVDHTALPPSHFTKSAISSSIMSSEYHLDDHEYLESKSRCVFISDMMRPMKRQNCGYNRPAPHSKASAPRIAPVNVASHTIASINAFRVRIHSTPCIIEGTLFLLLTETVRTKAVSLGDTHHAPEAHSNIEQLLTPGHRSVY